MLLDDVVTTGATFMACRKLLLDVGVAEIICLALGKILCLLVKVTKTGFVFKLGLADYAFAPSGDIACRDIVIAA